MKLDSKKSGFTIIELLVVVSIIGLLLSLLIPAVGKARDGALTTQSTANLKNLATACAAYATDWNDRQPTFVADDLGAHIGGEFTVEAEKRYIQNTGSCPPSMIAGYGKVLGNCGKKPPGKGGGGFGGRGGGGGGLGAPSPVTPGIWGMWTQCESMGMPKNWGLTAATPMCLGSDWGEGISPGDGAFRMSNCRSFNQYVGGKFYDKVFYSPKDKISLDKAQPAFEIGDDFTLLCNIPGHEVPSSYCFSVAGMYAPEAFGSKTGCLSFKTSGLPNGVFRSPSTGQTAYPELKTRMIEHAWLQNKEGPDFQPHFKPPTVESYYFNHCINSQPASMFFDAHIGLAGCQRSMDAHVQVMEANKASSRNLKEDGLFAYSTLGNIGKGPWGGWGGYFTGPAAKEDGAAFNYDTDVFTNFHIFTVDGVLGRDFIVSD